MKCHPYLWLAPPYLPLAPCLNPQSACYIYIVMRALLLTKHFLFDCTHKKRGKSLQIALTNSSGRFQQIFSRRLYYSTSNLKISLLSRLLVFPQVFFLPRNDFFPCCSGRFDSRRGGNLWQNYKTYLTQINFRVTDKKICLFICLFARLLRGGWKKLNTDTESHFSVTLSLVTHSTNWHSTGARNRT